MLHKRCSTKEATKLLPSWSTSNFKKSWLLQMHIGLIVVNWNQKTRIRILSILKLLCTGCSTKDAISLVISWSTWNFRIKSLLYTDFGSMLPNQIKKLEQDTTHFKIATYRVLHERSSKTASFAEHLNRQEKSTFADALWITCSKLKLKN